MPEQMKRSGRDRKGGLFTGIAVLLGLLLVANVLGLIVQSREISAYAVYERIDEYQTRSELLQDATRYIGACNAEQAAEVWAAGVQNRNGGLQYAIMADELQVRYERSLSKNFPNWVTGVSSPWISCFQVQKGTQDDDVQYFTILFETETSTGSYEVLKATVGVCREELYWRVTSIQADPGLDIYTGFIE